MEGKSSDLSPSPLKILGYYRMKQSGLPSLALAGTSGSVEMERARHALRKAKSEKAKAEAAAKVPVLPKPEPAKREKLAAPEPAVRFTVKDFVRNHFSSE